MMIFAIGCVVFFLFRALARASLEVLKKRPRKDLVAYAFAGVVGLFIGLGMMVYSVLKFLSGYLP